MTYFLGQTKNGIKDDEIETANAQLEKTSSKTQGSSTSTQSDSNFKFLSQSVYDNIQKQVDKTQNI